MPYSRAFTRSLGFHMLMFNADKGGNSGGGSSTLTIPELTQRVKDLESEKQSLEARATEADALDVKVARLENAVKAADAKSAESKLALDAALKEKTDAESAKVAAQQAKTKAETDLKTADERVESRLREISAKNGGTLPPKVHAAGDFAGKSGVKSLTRAEFAALPWNEKSAAMRDGTKITD